MFRIDFPLRNTPEQCRALVRWAVHAFQVGATLPPACERASCAEVARDGLSATMSVRDAEGQELARFLATRKGLRRTDG